MQAAGAVGGAGVDSNLVQKVDVFVSARNLRKLDLTSNSDPFCVFFAKAYPSTTFVEVGRSEVIMDTQNPDWTHQFVLNYFFEEVQDFRVEVYDEDKKGVADLTKHDLCGRCEFKLGSLMGSASQSMQLNLSNNDSNSGNGMIILKAEPVTECNDFFRVQFAATRKLAKKDGFFAKSDPFIAAHRLREDNSWVRVWKSEVVESNLQPTWKIASIPVQQLCNGDYDRPIKFEVNDWDPDGSTDYMGSFQCSLRDLMTGGTRERPVIEEEKKKKKSSYTDSGAICCRLSEIHREYGFLDYIRGGCQLNFMVAIDFTGSNGNPTSASSLHYIDPSGRGLNEYQQAIQSVGQVVQEYDTDKLFPVFGFGARVNGTVSHAFSIFPPGVEAQGVEGIMHAYRECLPRVELSGPTLFTPIISAAVARCNTANSQQHQHYTVLLIICDGIINDMPQTIDTIIDASRYPMSIIIVGVGSADFSDMNALDADGRVLASQSSGKKAVRDIVQFVPMRTFSTQHLSRLAAEVLKEVPGQLAQYMKACNFIPNPSPTPPQGFVIPQSRTARPVGELPPAYEEAKR